MAQNDNNRKDGSLPDAWDAELVANIVQEEMRDVWNEICSDTGHHPLDIEQGYEGRKKLSFEPRHWARITGERVAVRLEALSAGRKDAT